MVLSSGDTINCNVVVFCTDNPEIRSWSMFDQHGGVAKQDGRLGSLDHNILSAAYSNLAFIGCEVSRLAVCVCVGGGSYVPLL